MILVENGKLVIETYIMEAYRRLYDASVRYDMTLTSFLTLMMFEDIDAIGRINIPYDDYFCPLDSFNNILEDLYREPYVLKNGHAEHKLIKREIDRIRSTVLLGCSPITSYDTMVATRPCSKEFIETFDSYSSKHDRPIRKGYL